MRWHKLVYITFTVVAVGVTAASHAQERFDYRVRDDMFRAFGGNEAAFKNAMSVIEEKLREDPNHAEALVWRGAAHYWETGQAFRAGNTAGFQVLASSNIGVLIPRAATLLVAARNLRDSAQTQSLAALAAADFESALVIREPAFDRLGQHNRGEYLSGLAESWALAGNRDKAEGYLRRIFAELPNSPYAERAAAKFADWSDRRPLNCQTCH
jgi:tetratricopeptide (TPR) repeat protein